MFKMSCPRDGTPLTTVRQGGLMSHRCDRCDGRAITLSALRRHAIAGMDRRIWLAAQGAGLPEGTRCPSCARTSLAVRISDAEGQPLEVDVCRPCALVWLDVGEGERVSAPPPPESASQTTPESAVSQALVVAMVTRRPLASSDPAQRELARRFGTAGGLEELDRGPIGPFSLVVGLVAGVSVFASLGREEYVVERFGLIPAAMWRPEEAARWLTYPFTPTDPYSDPYLDVLCAAGVVSIGGALERIWGSPRAALCLALGLLGGGLAHTLLDPYPYYPVGGTFGLLIAPLMVMWMERPRGMFAWRAEEPDAPPPSPWSLSAGELPFGEVAVTPQRLLVFLALIHVGFLAARSFPDDFPDPLLFSPWIGLGGALGGLVAWFTLRPSWARRRASR